MLNCCLIRYKLIRWWRTQGTAGASWGWSVIKHGFQCLSTLSDLWECFTACRVPFWFFCFVKRAALRTSDLKSKNRKARPQSLDILRASCALSSGLGRKKTWTVQQWHLWAQQIWIWRISICQKIAQRVGILTDLILLWWLWSKQWRHIALRCNVSGMCTCMCIISQCSPMPDNVAAFSFSSCRTKDDLNTLNPQINPLFSWGSKTMLLYSTTNWSWSLHTALNEHLLFLL